MKNIIPYLLLSFALVGCQTQPTEPIVDETVSSAASSPTSAENPAWQSYTNNFYEFSLPYPKDWIYVERKEQYGKEAFSVAFRPQFPEVGDADSGMIVFSVYNTDITIDEFIDTHLCDSPDVCASSQNAIPLIVAGTEAKKIINPPAPIETEVVALKMGNRIYQMSIGLDASYDDMYSLDQKRELFEYMLANTDVSLQDTPTSDSYQ